MQQLPAIFTIFLSVFGGVYFGLFFCGGYAWHKPLFLAVLGLAVVSSLFFSFLRRASWLLKVSYILISTVAFIIFEAAGAAFYPSAPESLQNFLHSFVFALEHGPC